MNDMHEIDNELRRALRRVDPPEGFADRVRERVSQPVSRKHPPLAFARWAIAAALVIAVTGGAWYRAEQQRDVQRRAQGEDAKRQVLVSLNIASHKLRAIEMKVNRREDR